MARDGIKHNLKRDIEIKGLVGKIPYSKIGKIYNISRQRVFQIIKDGN